MTDVLKRLEEIGLKLPEASDPVANYSSFVVQNGLVYISGQLSLGTSRSVKGVLGADLSIKEGAAAAELCALNVLAQLGKACGGRFDKVHSIVKIGVFVQTAPGFIDIPQVANGCSDLLAALFPDATLPARKAVGVSSLPLGCAVEVDATVLLK